MRMQSHRLPNLALHGEVHGKRTQGRPKKRWIDNVKEDLESVGVAGGKASQGRGIVRAGGYFQQKPNASSRCRHGLKS